MSGVRDEIELQSFDSAHSSHDSDDVDALALARPATAAAPASEDSETSSSSSSSSMGTSTTSSSIDDRELDERIDEMLRRDAEQQARPAPTLGAWLATLYMWFKSKGAINLLSALAVTLSIALLWYNSEWQQPCFDTLSMFLGGFVTLTGLISLTLLFELVMKCVVGFEIVTAINTPRLMCACFVVGVKVVCIAAFLGWSAMGVVYIVDAATNDDCTFTNGVLWAFCLQLIIVLICCCTVCFATYRVLAARRRRRRLQRMRPLIAIKPQPYRPQMFADTEDAQCAICLDPYADGAMLQRCPCNHYFHVDCINSWLSRSHLCPLCQKPVVDENAVDAPLAAPPLAAAAAVVPAAGGGGAIHFADDDSFSDTF